MEVQYSSPAFRNWSKAVTYWMTLCVWRQPFQGIPVQADLYHPGCPRVGQHSLNHGGMHRPGDTGLETEPLIMAPDFQLLCTHFQDGYVESLQKPNGTEEDYH